MATSQPLDASDAGRIKVVDSEGPLWGRHDALAVAVVSRLSTVPVDDVESIL